MENNGRPEYTDEQYLVWLDEMAPFLKMGNSLHFAIEKTLLGKHKDSIYRKYRLGNWFCEKIEAFQRYPGEILNSIFSKLVLKIDDKFKQGLPIDDEEWRNLRFLAEKHRSCQSFFVTRHEVAQIEPGQISKLLDELEPGVITSDYAILGKDAERELGKMRV